MSIEGKTRKLDYLTRLYIPDESYQEFPTDSNGFVLDKIKACEIKPPEGGLLIYGLLRAAALILKRAAARYAVAAMAKRLLPGLRDAAPHRGALRKHLRCSRAPAQSLECCRGRGRVWLHFRAR